MTLGQLSLQSLFLAFSVTVVSTTPVQQHVAGHQTPQTAGDCDGWIATVGVNSSPYAPPEATDATFVVNQGPGLDTGCTFVSGSPLVFSIPVNRHVGNVPQLKANGFISETAVLQMPAFDVDFAGAPGVVPERDRVSFNGHVVPEEFLTGSNNVWKLNTFQVPIDWVIFPPDPGAGGLVQQAFNEVRIDIDTGNGGQNVWCTAIDWASLKIDVARPVVMAHGIFSSGNAWDTVWVPKLTNEIGLPNDNELDMGPLESISDNALKIAAVVNADRARWGVEKVVLVCHSKGGIDARHYVEHGDSVSKVIQIATPNAGSRLADAAQLGAVSLFGLLGAAEINQLAGLAGLQLTTPHMAFYNFVHHENDDVKYYALAGDYTPNCGFFTSLVCAGLQAGLAISGKPGDAIVRTSSVYTLPYTINLPAHVSSGIDDLSATHFGLNDSPEVFESLLGILSTDSPGVITATVQDTLSSIASMEANVIQQGQVQSFDLPVDHPGPSTMLVLYPSGDLDLTLTSPTGQIYDEATAAGNPNVNFGEGAIAGGLMETFQFTATEVGIWHVAVKAESVIEPSGFVSYGATALFDEAIISLEAGFGSQHISVGQDLVIKATLQNGVQPIVGASASAFVRTPDGMLIPVPLLDGGLEPDSVEGDGTYTGTFANTSTAGTCLIAFKTEGGGSGLTFGRDAFGIATVAESSSSIIGGVTDFGVDTDGNSFFNSLVVRVSINSTLQTDYRVVAELKDSAGHSQHVSVIANLPTGVQNVDLHFDGELLFKNGVDGPYVLSRLVLVEESGDDILILDEELNLYQTAAYLFTEFEHGPIVFTGHGADQGIDTNGNGLFDLLNVQVEALIEFPGSYQWSGRLVDPAGAEVGFGSGSASLVHGLNQLPFTFDGEQIGQHGTDGPYTVRDILISSSSQSLVTGAVYTTGQYSANQFEGGNMPPDCSAAFSSLPVLWPPNHQMVAVAIEGISDPDNDPLVVEITAIAQDEPVNGTGDGNTAPDGQGVGTSSAIVRAERAGGGNGRVYTIFFMATDPAGATCQGSVKVCVPHSNMSGCVDDGPLFDSTQE